MTLKKRKLSMSKIKLSKILLDELELSTHLNSTKELIDAIKNAQSQKDAESKAKIINDKIENLFLKSN